MPEATMIVTKVVKDKKNGELQFHLGKILEVKYWDRENEKPKKN